MIGEFKMPSLGADMEAGTLVEWSVEPGAEVKRGDIVAVVETQKGAIDVEIYQAGKIVELVVPVGTEVPVGTVLATLEVEGEGAAVAPAEAPREAETPPVARIEPGPAAAMSPTREAPPPARGARVSPRARKRAQELGLDPSQLTGTGPDGSVTAEDVEAAAAAASRAPAKPGGAMREAIAAAMSRSNREIPHYYLGHTANIEPALSRLEADNAQRSIKERIVPVALLVRAVARGLREFPTLSGFYRNGRFEPGDGIHVGLAVALRDGGLVNPAIFDTDKLSLPDLMRAITDVTERARRGSLRASELGGATITVTSLGERGVDAVYGVIHPPQVAIVGFGTIHAQPWVVGDAVVPCRVVQMTLAADHRVSDGRLGARFLDHVARSILEDT